MREEAVRLRSKVNELQHEKSDLKKQHESHLAEEEEQAHDDARKRRAERKQARKARHALATLAPSAAKRARQDLSSQDSDAQV